MLEAFPTETEVQRAEKPPLKLDGFFPEGALEAPAADNRERPRLLSAPTPPSRRPAPPQPPPPAASAVLKSAAIANQAVYAAPTHRDSVRQAPRIAKPQVAVVAAIALVLILIAGWRLTPIAELKQGDQRQVDILLPAERIARAQPQRPVEVPASVPETPKLAAIAPAPRATQERSAVPSPTTPAKAADMAKSVRAVDVEARPKTSAPATPASSRPAAITASTASAARLNAPTVRAPVTVANATAATLRADPVPLEPKPLPRVVANVEPVQPVTEERAVGTSGTLSAAVVVPAAAVPPGASTPPANLANRTVIAAAANDTTAIREVIRRYETAYERLDAAAAKEIWPSLDERALAKAFAGLSSQTLTLQPCQIDVASSSAVASCRGYATYVGRVGPKSGRVQQRDWKFVLRKSTEGWQIGSVQSN